MDIPALSMAMAQMEVQSAFSTKMLSNALDTNEVMAQGVVNMIDRSAMELSVNPNVGANFDVSV